MINKKLLYPFLLFLTGFIFLQNMYSQENDLTDDKNPAGNNAIAEENDTVQRDFLEKNIKTFYIPIRMEFFLVINLSLESIKG